MAGLEIVFASLEALKRLGEVASGIKGGEVLEKHLNFLRDQLELQGKAQAQSEEQLRDAERKVAELERQLDLQWAHYRGLLFRRLPSGKLDRGVYCPICKVIMEPENSIGDYIPERGCCADLGFKGRFICHRCNWVSTETGLSLDALFGLVAGEYGTEFAN